MKNNRLGNSDLLLSNIGLGTWAIGGGNWEWGWGPQDDDESISTILHALELGINWIDTAPAYGLGHSEEIVSKALKEWNEQVVVATKCGNIWEEGGKAVTKCLKVESVRHEIEASLKRLEVDAIDLLQIHWPIPDEDLEEGWGEIANAVRMGKVRYAGVCNCNIEQLKRLQCIHPVTSLQNPYSMLERTLEKEILEYCYENNIGVLAYSPLQTGLLTGKYSLESINALPKNDWRVLKSPHFKDPLLSVNLLYIEKIRQVAETKRVKLSQLAISWVLSHIQITAAIVGSRKPSQIEESVKGADITLSINEQSQIAEFFDVYEEEIKN